MGGREWEGGREREREKKIWKECGREIEAEGGRRENQRVSEQRVSDRGQERELPGDLDGTRDVRNVEAGRERGGKRSLRGNGE